MRLMWHDDLNLGNLVIVRIRVLGITIHGRGSLLKSPRPELAPVSGLVSKRQGVCIVVKEIRQN